MEAEKRFATTLLQALARRPVKTAFSFDPSPSLWAPLPPCSRPFDLIRKSDGEDANTGAPTETETLTITVKQLKGGSPIQLTVGKFETVDELKKKIEAATGVAPANQRLVLNGKGLTEGKTLFDFDIKDGGTISLLKKAGGAPAATSPAVPAEMQAPATAAAPAASTRAATKELGAISTTALNPEFWSGLQEFIGGHLSEKADQTKVITSFGEAFLSLSTELSQEQKRAVRKRFTHS